MAIVVASYRQTVRAYAQSGGAYIVAKENLGKLPSLVAAALLVDYVLTVAVSVASGIFAITSAVTSLAPYRVELSLAAIALVAIVNLRGVREAGILLFAIPTYVFVALSALDRGRAARCATGRCAPWTVPHPLTAGTGRRSTVLVLLRAFSSGSAALTGVEAIANGVNAFRRPAKNAARTLAILGAIAISLLGVSWLAVHLHARPSSTDSVLSQIARTVFPGSVGRVPLLGRQGLHLRSSSSSRPTRRSRASRASPHYWRGTASRRASSRTSATASSSRTVSSFSPRSPAALILIYHANVNS